MVTFNRLNADPNITGSDQVPVYDSGSNRLRKGTMTQVAEFVRTSLGLDNELVEEAPNDGFIYGRQNKAWTTISKDDAGKVVPLIAPRQTGDGVKLEFDSPVDYAADPRGFFVEVDGITQRPTSPNSVADYSINENGKVVFTEAVPDGALVDVRFFQPSTEATDRTQDTVIANGSTTARTLGSRFADVANVKDFGAIGDGVADDTVAIQAACDRYTEVYFPEGTYRCNIRTASKLTGSGASVIKPYDLGVASVTLLNHGKSWKYQEISNIDFEGDGLGNDDSALDGSGLGIEFDAYGTGRYSFRNCTWKKFDIAFNRNLGNIGIAFYSCDWEHNNIAINCLSSAPPQTMHNGNMYLYGCQLSQNNKHCIYTDGDPSQIVCNETIFEYNHGIWIFVDGKQIPEYQIRDIYPSSFNNCYMEGHATDDIIDVNGKPYKSSIMTLVNSRKIVINDSNIGETRLYDSKLVTHGCYIGENVVKFGDSEMQNHDAMFYAVTYPAMKSIRAVDVENPAYNYMWQMESDLKFHDISSVSGDLIDLATPTEIRMYDAAHYTIQTYNGIKVARAQASAGTLIPVFSTASKDTTKEFIVTTVHARTNQSTWEVRAYRSVSTLIHSDGDIVVYSVISRNTGNSITPRVTFEPQNDSDILDIAQVAVVAFETYEDAIKHVNNPTLVKKGSSVYTQNLEGAAVDYSQIHNEDYLTSITGVDFEDVGVFNTKFGVSAINRPSAIDSNYPKATATRDVDGNFKWEFSTGSRIIWQDASGGVRYVTTTS